MIEIYTKKVTIPENLGLKVSGHEIELSLGDKKISKNIRVEGIELQQENHSILISLKGKGKRVQSIGKTIESHIQNMITGVTEGYTYELEIVFSHFPMNVSVKDKEIIINNFCGEKKPRIALIRGKTSVEVKGKKVTVKGFDKEEVSQTAANIENATKIRGRDIRVYQDGVYITSKAGKKL
ncbi:MAG: 50S ribosomal protein L6 [archaeon]